jgi:hypothetical protein
MSSPGTPIATSSRESPLKSPTAGQELAPRGGQPHAARAEENLHRAALKTRRIDFPRYEDREVADRIDVEIAGGAAQSAVASGRPWRPRLCRDRRPFRRRAGLQILVRHPDREIT